MANKPNNPALWSRAKSMAKQKYDVYPSAYANGWAAKWYKSHGGSWRKAEYGMQVPMMADGGKPEWLLEAQLKAQGYSGDALHQKMSSMANGGYYMGNDGQQHMSTGSNWSGNAFYEDGGDTPEYAGGGITHAGHHFPGYNRPIADSDGKHKKVVLAKVGDKVKVVHFGAKGYSNNYSAKARAAYKKRHAGEGSQSKLTAGYWAYHNLWSSHSPANHAGRSSGHGERFAQDGGQMDMYANGGTNNPGFRALPEYVQEKIMSNMGYGGYTPQMAAGGWAQQAAIAIAMKKAGKKPKSMAEGGEPENEEPNGSMAMGQMAAVVDKMSKLLKFVKPDQNLDPWIAYKLAIMDDSASSISDYMMYNPEAKGEAEEKEMQMGGYIPMYGEYAYGGQPCYECGGMYAKGGHVGHKKKKVNHLPIHQNGMIHPAYGYPMGYPNHPAMMAPSGHSEVGESAADEANESPAMQASEAASGSEMKWGGNYAYGGIHINPKNKGKFTASAHKAGYNNVQKFASHVLANKDQYSSTMVKRANFAKNVSKFKHQDGGPVIGDELDVTPDQLEQLRQQGYHFDII